MATGHHGWGQVTLRTPSPIVAPDVVPTLTGAVSRADAWAVWAQAFIASRGRLIPSSQPGGRAADTPRPPGIPLRRGERGRRFPQVDAQHLGALALEPAHEHLVVRGHALGAPERLELEQEQLQLAAQRRVRGLDA